MDEQLETILTYEDSRYWALSLWLDESGSYYTTDSDGDTEHECLTFEEVEELRKDSEDYVQSYLELVAISGDDYAGILLVSTTKDVSAHLDILVTLHGDAIRVDLATINGRHYAPTKIPKGVREYLCMNDDLFLEDVTLDDIRKNNTDGIKVIKDDGGYRLKGEANWTEDLSPQELYDHTVTAATNALNA